MQDTKTAEESAVNAAENWLALIDQGNIDESWNRAAPIFKSAVTSEQWKAALAAARLSFGKIVSRELKSKRYAEELPGAPDGEYVVIEFETVFEKKQHAAETITPMKDADGEWRISGYFIK